MMLVRQAVELEMHTFASSDHPREPQGEHYHNVPGNMYNCRVSRYKDSNNKKLFYQCGVVFSTDFNYFEFISD